jgi:hypothetical protein
LHKLGPSDDFQRDFSAEALDLLRGGTLSLTELLARGWAYGDPPGSPKVRVCPD